MRVNCSTCIYVNNSPGLIKIVELHFSLHLNIPVTFQCYLAEIILLSIVIFNLLWLFSLSWSHKKWTFSIPLPFRLAYAFIKGEFYNRKHGVNSVLLFIFALIKAVFRNNNTRFWTTIELSQSILQQNKYLKYIWQVPEKLDYK